MLDEKMVTNPRASFVRNTVLYRADTFQLSSETSILKANAGNYFSL